MAYALPHEVADYTVDLGSRRRRRREALRRKHAAKQAARAAQAEQASAAQQLAIYRNKIRACKTVRDAQARDLQKAQEQINQLQQQIRAQQEEIQEIDQALPMEGIMQAELDDFVDIGQRRRRGVQQAAQRVARAAGVPGMAQPAGVFAEGGMFLGLLVVVGIVILASTRR
jgi:chromosome segregation ATPase